MSTDDADGGEDRSAAIRERFEALGVSEREFHERTAIDRKTLRRAMAGESTVRVGTYNSIEAALDRLEAQAAGKPARWRVAGDPEADLVELVFEETPGMRAVVRGPVRDVEELEDSLTRLVTKMRALRASGDPDST